MDFPSCPVGGICRLPIDGVLAWIVFVCPRAQEDNATPQGSANTHWRGLRKVWKGS